MNLKNNLCNYINSKNENLEKTEKKVEHAASLSYL